MSCPTCDHTMQSLRHEMFWCPRCGTFKHEVSGHIYVPKLVDRCRSFIGCITDRQFLSFWRECGLSESINLPADRRPT